MTLAAICCTVARQSSNCCVLNSCAAGGPVASPLHSSATGSENWFLTPHHWTGHELPFCKRVYREVVIDLPATPQWGGTRRASIANMLICTLFLLHRRPLLAVAGALASASRFSSASIVIASSTSLGLTRTMLGARARSLRKAEGIDCLYLYILLDLICRSSAPLSRTRARTSL